MKNPILSTSSKSALGPVGIRGRLGLFASVAVVSVMIVVGVVVDHNSVETTHEQVRMRSAALLRAFSVPCGIALATGDLESLDTYISEVARAGRSDLGILHVLMVDHDGHSVVESLFDTAGMRRGAGSEAEERRKGFLTRAVAADNPLWERSVTAQGEPTLWISMPAVSGLRWGTLIAQFSMRAEQARITTSRTVVAGVILLVALVVLSVLFWGLWRIVVRPVAQLSWAARQIKGGDLTSRAQVHSEDELGQLAAVFNDMASELQSYTSQLEAKVQQRTAELHTKNEELELVNGKLRHAVAELDRLARTDPLTGAFNRGHLMEALNAEIARAQRGHGSFCLILCDVDHFKNFNDTMGHQAGDDVLVEVVDRMSTKLRGTDLLSRYGGEEFVVLVLHADLEAGCQVAEELRRRVEAPDFVSSTGAALGRVTMSLGVAQYPLHARDATQLLAAADQALYAAKASGRNRVEIATTLRSEGPQGGSSPGGDSPDPS